MDHVAQLLLELGLLFAGLSLLGVLARRLGLSSVPFVLVAALALGEGGVVPLATSEPFIEAAAEIGVVLLLLALGLEFSADELFASLRHHGPSGLVDLLLNALPGFAAGLLLGLPWQGALALAGVTWISSSGIIARLLGDLGRLANRETPAVLSVLVLEDLAMALFLPLLVVVGGQEPAEPVALPLGGQQRQPDGARRQRDARRRRRRPAAGERDGQQREEQRHRQVLEDQHRQHRRGLPVGQPPQVAEQPGDDARRGDPGDPGQGERALPRQTEQQSRDEARWRVEQQVHQTRGAVVAQRREQLPGGELQAEGEQQQDDADLRGGLDERLRRRQRGDPALAERQRGQQHEGHRRQAQPAGQQTDERQAEEQQAQFEQQLGDVLHRGRYAGSSRCRSRSARPRADPIATTTSPGCSRSPGPGDGTTSVSRTTATMEQPVSVRARVSPSGRPAKREPSRIGKRPDSRPGTSRDRSAKRCVRRGAPSTSATASTSSGSSRSTPRARSGSRRS